jgi:hypothetical protein
MNRVLVREQMKVQGRVRVVHQGVRDGQPVPLQDAISPRARAHLLAQGIDPRALIEANNLVVNVGRNKLARLLAGDSRAYINRLQLGDVLVGSVVSKSTFPADLSDTALVHEIRNLGGQPGATFDLDEHVYPGTVVKVSALVGTPATLMAGSPGRLTDAGQDFIAAGVREEDTVTAYIGGEDYTLGIRRVLSATELELDNPGQVSGTVGYTIQTPGTQVLFRKLISGDNFPESGFGPATVVHEAGLLFSDSTLFNRVVFQPQDSTLGLLLQPTDDGGNRIDVQLDWLITF